ncbi:MAG: hypothetical protein ACXW27_07770 [Allosphingosinicella sp.]
MATKPTGLSADIPIGDLKLFDNYVPSLNAGNWRIEAGQGVWQGGVNIAVDAQGTPDSFDAVQEFLVSAPQFAIDPGAIVNRYPPTNSSAPYGEVLPHIVFSDPMLAWERAMAPPDDTGPRQPWLALLVLTDDELVGGETDSTRRRTTTVKQFLADDPVVLKPSLVQEDDVQDGDPCAFITVSTETFTAVLPTLEELRYLAHCRQVNTGDKAILGLNEHGLFSVVVANRFPAVPAGEGDPATKNYAHLVSVEGLQDWLKPGADFGSHKQVALLSLASWSFQAQADIKEDFSGLANNLVAPDANALWLRLRPAALAGQDPVSTEAKDRLAEGFVPLPWHLRTGDDSFAWYRGPLTPVAPAPLAKTGPFPTSDAALIYHKSFGLFDASLAAAWEAGRAAALSDRVYGKQLLDFRRRAHGLTDLLLERLQADHFSVTDVNAVDPDGLVQHQFLDLLAKQLVADISGASGSPQPAGGAAAPAQASAPGSVKADIQQFVADPSVQTTLTGLIADDLDPVARWLAKLLLLYPVPFAYLVPDERMLPVESLRFFYIDNNWTAALLDGATSIGMESSRQSLFHAITRGLVENAAYEAAQSIRSNLLGVEPPATESSRQLMSGLLLRSDLVSGWPTLAVRPCLSDGTMLKILRMDHLSPNILLCIFWGVPDYVDIAEPQEGFRFGVDDSGHAELRCPIDATAAGGLALGAQLENATPMPVFAPDSGCMRAAGSRVLNVSAAGGGGLVAKLQSALGTAMKPSAVPDLGPADLALQMVKSPEAARFASGTGS